MPMDLSERIRAINRMHGAEPKESVTPTPEDALEQEHIATLKEEVEPIWEEAAKTQNEVTLEKVYTAVQELKEAIEAQAGEIKKINKHVNMTQKMLKKDK